MLAPFSCTNLMGGALMKKRWLLTGFLAGGLFLVTSCALFTSTTANTETNGGLRTLVIPDDAEVFVDGTSMGPASRYRGHTVIPLKGGKHVVEIKKDGYLPYHDEIVINKNLLTLTVTLKKE